MKILQIDRASWDKGVLKSGLTLTIPGRLSLLYQVLMQGYPIVDNYPQLISKNIKIRFIGKFLAV